MVRSILGKAGERIIAITLNAGHLVVARSLRRTDTLLIRFLLSLALAEYVGFWRGKPDGQALGAALIEAASIEPERFFGITLASKLAGSELLRPLDAIPIFGPTPNLEVHQLVKLAAVPLRGDILNWRPKLEQKETGQ